MMIEQSDIMKFFAIPSLKGSIHTEIEQSRTVLHHTVHIVAGKGLIRFVLFLEHTELVAVVAVDTVTGCHPQETVTIEVHLGHITAGKLLIIGCKIFAHLSTGTQRETKR